MQSCLVPESKFNPVAYTNFVVDFAEVVPDNIEADAKLSADLTIVQARSGQLNDRELTLSRLVLNQ